MEVEGESKWMKIFPYCWLNWIALQLYTNTYSTSALMLSFIRFRQWSTLLLTDWAPHSRRKISSENSLEAHRRSREKKRNLLFVFAVRVAAVCKKLLHLQKNIFAEQKQTETRNKNKKLFAKQIYGIDFLLRSLTAIQFRLEIFTQTCSWLGEGMFSLWMMIMREFVNSASLLNYFLGFNN